MGQYYLIANFDTREYIDPSAFDDDLNFKSFGASINSSMSAVALLIGTTWRGNHIGVVGDYGSQYDMNTAILDKDIILDDRNDLNMYFIASRGTYDFVDVNNLGKGMLRSHGLHGVKNLQTDYTKLDYEGVIFNHTKQQYIRGDVFGDSNNVSRFITGGSGGVLHTLSMILGLSYGGGEEIYGNDHVGYMSSWIGDRIGYVPVEEIAESTQDVSLIARSITKTYLNYVTYSEDKNGNVIRGNVW